MRTPFNLGDSKKPQQPKRGIGLYVNADETEFMRFNQDGTICKLNATV